MKISIVFISDVGCFNLVLKRFPADCDEQQLQLIYISLYLLIWGEASNVRFMPECICYIFHNVSFFFSQL